MGTFRKHANIFFEQRQILPDDNAKTLGLIFFN